MATQHSDKRIKLFLERSIERLPFDITDKAEEIYLPDGDPAEKLKRKIKIISDVAGDKFDEFTENLPSPHDQLDENVDSQQTAAQDEGASKDQGVGAAATTATSNAVANTRVTSPQGIYAKLWHAQGEIGIALDVLNIIISSYQATGSGGSGLGGLGGSGPGGLSISAPQNGIPPVLPPGSLKCEYVPKAIQSTAAQNANDKLSLGSKKHHLKNAANILMQGAQKLKRVMANEDQFWAEALKLRKNNWCIVSAKSGGGGYHANRMASASQLFVQYGFRDVGSLYGDRAYAELIRNHSMTKARGIQLNIPNKTSKVIVISLARQGQPHTHESRSSKFKDSRTLHSQILNAQTTLFDAELFQELVNEARSMTNSVSIVDNEIFLPINDELELKIGYKTPTADDTISKTELDNPRTAAGRSNDARRLEGTADIFRCAMQLIQHRRHRFNIKERTDSFFKSSRPGGGRVAGSFGQIQQTLQHRPTAMLSLTLQTLQYFSFSKKIHGVICRVTRNLRQSWWEPIRVHSVDVKSAPGGASSVLEASSISAVAAVASSVASTAAAAAQRVTNHGMGSALTISMGAKTPAIRFVLRSHPSPCVILQLSDRPPSPITHVAEFERILEEELASRAIRRICEVLNSVERWSDKVPTMQSPNFVIDIEKRCVGVFVIPAKQFNGMVPLQSQTANILLEIHMKAEAISLTLKCNQGDRTNTSRIYLEDYQLASAGIIGDSQSDRVHPHDGLSDSSPKARTLEGFRQWLQDRIVANLDFDAKTK